ncbi:MAG TPA: acyltransferase domain-containing protein, partial [Deltaproteobacteria bacterium]|nr:acyltransferase domain-containing protein [Deltaproteobacteria bacterium]
MSVHDPRQCPIAVVGVSAIFPGSVDATGFWNDIVEGRDLISDIPESHWLIDDYYDPDPSAPDKTYAHRGAFLPDVDFDPLEWGVPPSIVPATDTTQLLALIVAKQVLEDAAGDKLADLDRDRISCILGITSAQELLGTMVNRLQRPVWVKALRELGYAEDEIQVAAERIAAQYVPWQESTFPGLLGNVVAGRIANRLDLGGTNCVTDAACASSFSAVSMAVNELWLGQSDLVISGGADTMNDIFMYMCFSKTPALSRSGECRPFSDRADGTLLGEGLGMVALKRLADAERDGDRIYAVLKGIGSSSDGRSKSVYAPVSTGQAKALRRAYAMAGYDADTVELVEAHGTGTKAGDAAEFEGLRMAFTETSRADPQWCALGTVKSQIGHTKAAAGAAGLFKVVMALHHKILPPTIKIDRPNPKLEIDSSPFYLNTRSRPWIHGSAHPRRGSVSSFGFGGSNFHLALEEYTGPGQQALRTRTMPCELVVLSADTPAALAAAARRLADRSDVPGFLAHAAHAAAVSLDVSRPARLAVIASDEEELAARLRRLADRIDDDPTQALEIPTGLYYATDASPGQIALLFPGQGSQYPHMGGELAMAFDAARAAFDAAADLDLGDQPLHRVIFPLPAFDEATEARAEALLRATEWAQPAIGVTSLAMLGLLQQLGLSPDVVGGHSYGEVTALCAAGVLSPSDCLRVARRRGELMAEAAGSDGAMIAVPMTVEEVRPYSDAAPGAVLANHNTPNQVVVSGPTEAIDQIEAALRADGIDPKRLDVATAFHSPVVSASVEPFRSFLSEIEIQAPRIPVFHNPDATPYPSEPDAIREGLAGAVARPVRFVEQIEAMYAAGIRTFVEVGPGHVLSNLTAEILGDRPHAAIPMDRRRKHGVTSLFHALGRLCVAGVPLALERLWEGAAPTPDPHDRARPRLALAINGANYDKPYPPPGGSAALPRPNPTRTGAAMARDPEPRIVEKIVEKRVEVPAPVPVPVPAPPGPDAATTAHTADLSPSPAQQPTGASMSPAQQPTGASMSQQHPDPWILAFQEAQRATVEAHSAYQQAMASSHEQFLRTVEASLSGLQGLLGGVPAQPGLQGLLGGVPAQPGLQPAYPPMQPTQPAAQPTQPAAQPTQPTQPTQQSVPAPQPAAPPPPSEPPELSFGASPTRAPDDGISLVQNGVEVLGAASVPAPSAPQPPVATAVEALDLEALLLDVVSDKTGYPADMLEMSMALESDLGIDSIKRVEILSAVRDAAPGLPEVDTAEMARLQTLGQVVEHLRGSMGAGALTQGATTEAGGATAVEALDLEALLLDVVSDKTGYPADMLEMSMALESDLGIDSIKRVEILSAVRDAAPGLPEVDTAEMARLQTLGQVVEHLRGSMG